MKDVVDSSHLELASRMQEILAVYEEAKDLINIGAYVSGNNPEIDKALVFIEDVQHYLRQDIDERADMPACLDRLKQIFERQVT